MWNILLYSYFIYIIFYIITFSGTISTSSIALNPFNKYHITSYLTKWYYILTLVIIYGCSVGLSILLTLITKYDIIYIYCIYCYFSI